MLISFSRCRSLVAAAFAALLFVHAAQATIGTGLQMQLGNPSSSAADPANRTRFLIQRAQYALDYNDTTREPNWVSWNLTTSDVGSSGRADFITDTSLPAGFYRVTSSDYTNSGFDRGHMCPSADRSVTTADNQVTFLMSNVLPQAPDNNQGIWASFETYCRTLAAAGHEVLIVSGPSGFSAAAIPGGVAIPGHVWKIAVIVPVGAGTAVSRITSTTRVIALKVPNIQGVRSNPWQQYVTSAAQIESDTGYRFFTDLPAAIASEFRTRVDGQSSSGAPGITTHPTAQTANAGGTATFAVTANGTAPLSYQWMKGEVEIANATSPTLQLTNLQPGDAASYSVVVTNAVGSIASNAAPLTVLPLAATNGAYWNFDTATPAALAPGISSGALTQNNNNGTTATLTTASVSIGYTGASGASNAGAAARTGALNIAAGGSAFFEFTLIPAAERQVVATAITFGSRSTATGPQAYDIYTSADNYTTRIATGVLANNSVWALHAPAFTTVSGATGAPVTFRIFGYGGVGNAAASTANWRIDDLQFTAVAVSGEAQRLVNLSTRTTAGTGDQVAIVGFVLTGTEAKTVLVRAVGPTLRDFGLSTVLAAPRLDLMRSGTTAPLATNSSWSASANSAELAAAAARSGAFALTAGSADAAILTTLPPGNYTAVVTASDGRAGVTLVEVYDLSEASSAQRIANLSTRALTGTGDATLIAGVVIAGSAPKRVLIRAAGPSLSQFGVSGVLARPQLTLFSGSTSLATNAGWSTSADAPAITEAAVRTGAFAFGAASPDAALIVHLPPGAYTAQVTGVGGATGIALVEIYELP